MAEQRPTGLIAKKGIELLTWGTPNGFKIAIMLEELKEAYGKEYTFQAIDISKNIQKEAWYVKLGSNGQIPVIVDHDQGGFSVQEGSAIISYLARHYDPDHKFSFTDPFDISRAEQWVAWQHGNLGPMQAQAIHFNRFAKERVPYGIKKFTGETERLVSILDNHLKDKEYLVGDKYSIADIPSVSFVHMLRFSGVELELFPNVEAWWRRIIARPAVQRGLAIPYPIGFNNEGYMQKMKEDEEFAKREHELKDEIAAAKEQYASP